MTSSRKHGYAPRHAKRRNEYNTWCAMRQRCLQPTYKTYSLYGGRGIKICPQWDNFATFLRDVGPRPMGLTLDRINNDGDYEPNNVRWTSIAQQARNRRSTRLTPTDVAFIRHWIAIGYRPAVIARAFEVGTYLVCDIKNGRSWKEP